jgi:hypothetical protein
LTFALKVKHRGWAWWYTPVITAAQEASMREWQLEAIPGKKVNKTLSQKTSQACWFRPSYAEGGGKMIVI